MIKFEWDEEKALKNIKKHGISFEKNSEHLNANSLIVSECLRKLAGKVFLKYIISY